MNINFQNLASIPEVTYGSVVLSFRAIILFNACLSRSVNFNFRPLFYFAEVSFPSFVEVVINLDTAVFEKSIRLAVLDTDVLATQDPIIMILRMSNSSDTMAHC